MLTASLLLFPLLAAAVLVAVAGPIGFQVQRREAALDVIAVAAAAAAGLLAAQVRGAGAGVAQGLAPALAAAALLGLVRSGWSRGAASATGCAVSLAAVSAVVLLADGAAGGAARLRDLLAGRLEWMTPSETGLLAVVGLAVAAVQLAFWRQLRVVATERGLAREQGLTVGLWEGLFGLSLALAIAAVMPAAGALLTVAILLIPASIAAGLAEKAWAAVALAWIAGGLGCVLGLVTQVGRSAGPIIAGFLVMELLMAAFVEAVRRRTGWLPALMAMLVTLAASAWGVQMAAARFPALPSEESPVADRDFSQPRPALEEEHEYGDSLRDLEAALEDEHMSVRAQAALRMAVVRDPKAVSLLCRALSDPADAVRENAARSLAAIGAPEAAPFLLRALLRLGPDPWVRFRVQEALAMAGERRGVDLLLETVSGKGPRVMRNEVLAFLMGLRGQAHAAGNIDVDTAHGQKMIEHLRDWWRTGRARFVWVPKERVYR